MYILACIVYLIYGDASIYWGAVNIITQTGFIGYLAFELQKNSKGHEKLFLQYITALSAANVLYIMVCMYKDKFWIIHNTDLFAYILALGFAVFLIHCATQKQG